MRRALERGCHECVDLGLGRGEHSDAVLDVKCDRPLRRAGRRDPYARGYHAGVIEARKARGK